MPQRTSFYKFISEEQREHPLSNGKLTGLLLEVISACKKIAHLTGSGGLASHAMGAAESENIQGEQQKKLDILSNELFVCLLYTSPSPRDLSTSRMPSSA